MSNEVWHGVNSGDGFVPNLTVKSPDGLGKTLFRKMKAPEFTEVESVVVLLNDGQERTYPPDQLEIVEPAPIETKK
jgi:hypothetical protein